MQAEAFAIPGPLLLTPRLFGDDRGFFFESWNAQVFATLLAETGAEAPQPAPDFVQDNHSRSALGVLRGLHYQLAPHAQGKLVRCVAGEIFDVAVDLRRSSPHFGRWIGAHLSAGNHRQMWVPVGFAHGFLSLCDGSEVLYKTTDVWHRESERAIRWDDPQIGIDWPLASLAGLTPQLSGKDGEAPTLAEQLAAGEVFA
ncbi:MAG: dTDP-4-dehydrorhamnose 3,5-epimerase [Synechococcaceae cyanobacterium]|nr:dTDP-4-dehydrorhamnose 3,5-epimerase [Synechococcaceae cyanobacterium]